MTRENGKITAYGLEVGFAWVSTRVPCRAARRRLSLEGLVEPLGMRRAYHTDRAFISPGVIGEHEE